MERDLSPLFEEWPFEPGQITVRVIEGIDGAPRIQVRLDLGLLQMQAHARPGGKRPHGFDSLLDYHESKIDQDQIEADDAAELNDDSDAHGENNDEEQFLEPTDFDTQQAQEEARHERHERKESSGSRFLTPDDCRALREEAQQYYHRYIAMLVLEDYEAVVRDTSRNLRVLDLFANHAQLTDDRYAMESHRPYILMMRARSLASQALKTEENKAAILAIDEGVNALKLYYESIDQADQFDESGEVAMLKDMRDSLIPKLPVSQKAELRQRLDAAIVSENFELAAILRDEIRMLGG